MDLTNQQIKDTYGNVLTIGTTAGSPTTGTLQNGEGLNITSATLTGGTVTTSNPLLDMTQTWNDAGVTFTSLKLNVTNTASGASSILLDLQVGGSSKFKVDKSGKVFIEDTIYSFVNAPATGIGRAGNDLVFYSGATPTARLYSGGFGVASNNTIGFSASTILGGSLDTILARDAADTLAQRNGTNAQTFNIYNTYTDASNYERGFLKWNSNVLEIGTEALGTGTGRALALRSATNGINLDNNGLYWTTNGKGIGMGTASPPNTYNVIQSAGNIELRHNTTDSVAIRETSGFTNGAKLAFLTAANATHALLKTPNSGVLNLSDGAGGGATFELEEQTAPSAPSANAVRIYAVDNGSGKTQLMALFASGAAQQIAIEP